MARSVLWTTSLVRFVGLALVANACSPEAPDYGVDHTSEPVPPPACIETPTWSDARAIGPGQSLHAGVGWGGVLPDGKPRFGGIDAYGDIVIITTTPVLDTDHRGYRYSQDLDVWQPLPGVGNQSGPGSLASLRMTPRGLATLRYQEFATGTRLATHRPAQADWTDELFIPVESESVEHDIFTDQEGNVLAVGFVRPEEDWWLHSALLEAGSETWRHLEAQPLGRDWAPRDPVVRFDGTGAAVLGWQLTSAEGERRVALAQLAADGTWSAPQQLDSHGWLSALVAHPQGGQAVIITALEGGAELLVEEFDAALNSTGNVAQVAQNDTEGMADAQLATFADGSAVLVWGEGDPQSGSYSRRMMWSRNDGTTWSEPALLANVYAAGDHLQLEQDRCGRAWLAWATYIIGGGGSVLRVREFDSATANWSEVLDLATIEGNLGASGLAVNQDGRGVYFWDDDSSGENEIWAALLE